MKLSDYAPDDPIPLEAMLQIFPDFKRQAWNLMRYNGTGPIFTKVHGKVMYLRRDVDEWLCRNRMARTDTPAPEQQTRITKIKFSR